MKICKNEQREKLGNHGPLRRNERHPRNGKVLCYSEGFPRRSKAEGQKDPPSGSPRRSPATLRPSATPRRSATPR